MYFLFQKKNLPSNHDAGWTTIMNINKRLLLGAGSDMVLAEYMTRGSSFQPIVSVILVRTVIGY